MRRVAQRQDTRNLSISSGSPHSRIPESRTTVTPATVFPSLPGKSSGSSKNLEDAAAVSLPFQPVIRKIGASEIIKITPGVLRRGDTGDFVNITNVAANFAAGTSQSIFLEATISAFNITDVTAKVQSSWPGYPKCHQFSASPNFSQTKAYVELGRTGAGSTPGSVEVFNPWASGQMMLVLAIVDGRMAWTFTPGNA